jgi:hypothetical protein
MSRRISDHMSTTRRELLIEAALEEAVRRGFVQVIPSDDGEPRYLITQLGVEYFQRVLAGLEEE